MPTISSKEIVRLTRRRSKPLSKTIQHHESERAIEASWQTQQTIRGTRSHSRIDEVNLSKVHEKCYMRNAMASKGASFFRAVPRTGLSPSIKQIRVSRKGFRRPINGWNSFHTNNPPVCRPVSHCPGVALSDGCVSISTMIKYKCYI